MSMRFALPTINDVTPVNPVLSDLSIGFKNAEFLWDRIAPVQEVPLRAGTFFTFTRDYWMRRMEGAERAPEAGYTRLDYGVGSTNYKALEYGFEKVLGDPIKAASQTAEDLEAVDTEYLTQMIQLELEKQATAAFFVTGKWGTSRVLASGDQWSDLANSDPIADTDLARRTVRQNTGRTIGQLFLGALGWEKLKEHPLILDKYKHSQTGVMTRELVAAALELDEVVVGESVENTAAEGATFVGADIWADNALWKVADPPGLFSPVAAMHFIWNENNNVPWAVQSYRDEIIRSNVTRIFTHSVPIIPSSQSGYLALDLIA